MTTTPSIQAHFFRAESRSKSRIITHHNAPAWKKLWWRIRLFFINRKYANARRLQRRNKAQRGLLLGFGSSVRKAWTHLLPVIRMQSLRKADAPEAWAKLFRFEATRYIERRKDSANGWPNKWLELGLRSNHWRLENAAFAQSGSSSSPAAKRLVRINAVMSWRNKTLLVIGTKYDQ